MVGTHGRSESLRRNIPSWEEDQEICKRNTGGLGFGGKDAEDGRVDMVLVNAIDMGELLHCILVRDIAVASVNRNALA